MSPSDIQPGEPSQGGGGTTAKRGTPVSVDVSTDPGARSLIAIMLAGPVIWSAHFLAVYLLTEVVCSNEGTGSELLAPRVATVATLAATVVAALACLGTAGWGWRRWRADRQERAAGPGLEPADPGGALALLGALLSLLGLVTVVIVGVPALFLAPCAP